MMNIAVLGLWVGIVLMVLGVMGAWIAASHFSAHVSMLLTVVFAAVWFIGAGMGVSVWTA